MRPETFRRICMSFDAWVVAFGLSKLIRDLGLCEGAGAYLRARSRVIVVDAWLLYRFFCQPWHTASGARHRRRPWSERFNTRRYGRSGPAAAERAPKL